MADIIDGKARAAALRAELTTDVATLVDSTGVTPGLTVVLVGDDPASHVYVRNKVKSTTEVGMRSDEHRLPADTSEADVLALVEKLNADPSVNGILVQLPLPKHIDSAKVLAAINPDKDVDGFHVVNAGKLAVGERALVPCTPLGCLMMLQDSVGDLSGANAVVVGRSNIVGKPMAQLLLQESCTVTIAHSRTRNIEAVCRGADILVAAVGRPEMVRGDWVREGATVIDVGINRVEREDGKARLVGDVAFDEAAARARAITPVPGGVGPMTIACLLYNTVAATRAQLGVS
ncbi:MAG: bifunctional methylenetetrahydrofolate dehydrogenase/methenyltetrahydrofolate cyclohydrolase FolD [Pseudomonadota bacterium]